MLGQRPLRTDTLSPIVVNRCWPWCSVGRFVPICFVFISDQAVEAHARLFFDTLLGRTGKQLLYFAHQRGVKRRSDNMLSAIRSDNHRRDHGDGIILLECIHNRLPT